jgi:hypothetical protein
MADYFRIIIRTFSLTAAVTKESIADSSCSHSCIYLPPSRISSFSFGSIFWINQLLPVESTQIKIPKPSDRWTLCISFTCASVIMNLLAVNYRKKCRVMNRWEVLFFSGDFPTSEFYVSTFRNTRLFYLSGIFKQEEFFLLTPPMKMKLTECSETSTHKI